MSIPSTQRAFLLSAAGGDLVLVDNHPVVSPSKLEPGQCLVKLTHTGVCHSDLSLRNSEFNAVPLKKDLIGGHEGVGTVVAIGAHTQNNDIHVGDRVGIKFIANSCLSCDACYKGFEGCCPKLQASGATDDGTFCEYAVAYVNHVTLIPDSLDSAEASGILCAGITVYSALQQCNAHIGDWVVIPGAGGGLGHMAIQYATAMGLRVIAIDTGATKRELCLSLGASVWVDFKESPDVAKEVRDATGGLGAHAAIVAAVGNGAYKVAVTYLRPTGYLMVIGVPPEGVLEVPTQLMVAMGLTIKGIMVGSRQQSNEAISIAASGKVKCRYTIRGLSELDSVYDDMAKGKIVGRVVLDISK